jgi:hypothetical protein
VAKPEEIEAALIRFELRIGKGEPLVASIIANYGEVTTVTARPAGEGDQTVDTRIDVTVHRGKNGARVARFVVTLPGEDDWDTQVIVNVGEGATITAGDRVLKVLISNARA